MHNICKQPNSCRAVQSAGAQNWLGRKYVGVNLYVQSLVRVKLLNARGVGRTRTYIRTRSLHPRRERVCSAI